MEQFIGKSMSGDIKEAVYGLQDPKFIILFSKEELFEKNVHEIEKLYPGVPSIGCVGTSYAGNDFVEDGCSVVAFTGSVEAVMGILADIERTPVLNIKELDDNIKKIDAGSHNTVCIDLCTGNDGCVVTTLNMALGRYNLFTEHGYFDTYLNLMNSLGVHSGFVGMGEHYNRQHINQSMSCVAFE